MPKRTASDVSPGIARMDRDAAVAGDQQQQDPPDEVVDVRPADRDVARPPAHLGADHVRTRPDEAERDQEGDEEQELRLAARVDDPVPVGARDAPKHQHGRKPTGWLGPARSSCRCRNPRHRGRGPSRRHRPACRTLPPPPRSHPRGRRRGNPARRRRRAGPHEPRRSAGRAQGRRDRGATARRSRRPTMTVRPVVGVEGVAAAAEVADDRADVPGGAAHLGRVGLAALRVVEPAAGAAAVGVTEALRGGQDETPSPARWRREIRLSMRRWSFSVRTLIDAEALAPCPCTVQTESLTPGCAAAAAGPAADRSRQRAQDRHCFASPVASSSSIVTRHLGDRRAP